MFRKSWRGLLEDRFVSPGITISVAAVAGAVALYLAWHEPPRAQAVILGLAGTALILAVTRSCLHPKKHKRADKMLEFACLGLITALVVNLGTNRLQDWINMAPPQTDDLYRNHDLARLTGNAMAAVLEKAAQQPGDPADRDALARIAEGVREEIASGGGRDRPLFRWELWLPDAAHLRGNGVDEKSLVQYVRNRDTTALTEEVWTEFLHHAADECRVSFSEDGTRVPAAARRLHTEFGTMLREALKHDYAVGGEASKAFAAMDLNISGELLRGMDALLTEPPRLTLYEVRRANDRREITPDYQSVSIQHQMRLQIDNVEQLHWCILTIDGKKQVAIVRPDQLTKDANDLWAWQPTALPSETVLLISSQRELTVAERDDIVKKLENLMARAPVLALDPGYQIVWGEDAGGWKRVKAGRGAAVEPANDHGWMTQVCTELRKTPGLRFEGRTIAVTP